MTLLNDIKDILNSHGEIVRIKYYTISGATTSYDDDIAVTQSGNDLFTSGLIFPIKKGSTEAVLLQQGKLKNSDYVLYLNADVNISGQIIKFGIGSPNYEEWHLTEAGAQTWRYNGNDIYHKMYIRRLTTGSYYGEN